MKVPGGLYNTTWFLMMNEDKWNGISPEDRAAIEAISGEAFAGLAGEAWNKADAKAIGKLNDAGIEIHEAAPEILAAVIEKAAGYEALWIEAVGQDGYDGTAALRELRKQSGVTP